MDKAAALKPDAQLQPHQQALLRRAFDADDPATKLLLYHGLGSGKSLSGLAVAEHAGEPYTVVTPASLRPNYKKERDKWTDQRVPADVISYDALAAGHPVPNTGTVVMDEAAGLRNADTVKSQAAQQLAAQAHRLLLLTGTPIVNQPSDLAPLVNMLAGTQMTPEDFNQRFVGEKRVWPGLLAWLRGVPIGHTPAPAHVDELKKLLENHVDYYQPAKPVVPVTTEDVPVEMSADQARLYHGMFSKLPFLTRWRLQHDYPMSPAELRRTASFLTGPREVGLSTLPFMRGKADPYKAFQGSPKLQAAMASLKTELADPRKKALVFSNFIGAGLEPYAAGLQRAGIPAAMFHGGLNDAERKKMVEDYNTGKTRVGLIGPSGSEGLSFKGTQLVELLDDYWNAVRPNQSIGRALRLDSHAGLPAELRGVKTQRYVARLPLSFKDRLLNRLGIDESSKQRAADDYLRAMAERKSAFNEQFLNILREVGTRHKEAAQLNAQAPAVPLASPGPDKQAAHAAATVPGPAGSLPVPATAATAGVLDNLIKPAVDPTLAALLEAKAHSDRRQYQRKAQILRRLITAAPQEFVIDSEEPNGIVGLTWRGSGQVPANFRIHLPKALVPVPLQAA